METTKYEKNIVRNPLSWNTFPPYGPRLLFDSQNYFPDMNFGIRYTYITQPIHMEKPHAHDFDQFFCFMGTPEDQRVFDGEVELYLGEESTKVIINSTSVAFIPKGMVHCPVIWTRVSKPMAFVNIVLAASYTRSDQNEGYAGLMEIAAKESSLKDAAKALGGAVPQPAYLPEGYVVQKVYTVNDSARVLISDGPVDPKEVTVGDADGTGQKYLFRCKMSLIVKKRSPGKDDMAVFHGASVKIGSAQGVIVDKEQHNEFWWPFGKYLLSLAYGKKMPGDEVKKIAASFK